MKQIKFTFSLERTLLLSLLFFTSTQSFSQSPGGVSTGLELWLKADLGVTSSGGSVSQWSDQSGNTLHATQGTTTDQPTVSTATQNFNPMLTFDGSNDQLTSSFMASIVNNDVSFSTVSNRRSSRSGNYIVGQDGAGGTGQYLHYGYRDNTTFTEAFLGADINLTIPGFSSFNPANAGISLSTHSSTNGKYTSWNQNAILYEATNANTQNLTYNSLGKIGLVVSSFYEGDLAEIIIHSQELSTTDQQKIRSYLALKYGITLDQTPAQDYVASDGTTKLWDATVNTTYNNDIFGIGRDDSSALDQRIAKSINAGTLFTVSLDNNFTAANNDAARTTTFSDNRDFLIFAHNGGATTTQTTELNSIYDNRITREWQVQNTDSVGAVNVKFNGFGGYDLLSDTDGDFSTTADQTNLGTLDANGELTGVTFTDNAYLTLGRLVASPGGVSTGLSVWLKADAGTTGATADGQSLSGNWIDQSASGNDYTTVSGPTLQTGELNYNPAVEILSGGFDGPVGATLGTDLNVKIRL